MIAVKQAIPGVSPSSVGETTIMTVWPTAGAYKLGRLLGRLYSWVSSVNVGIGNILTLRNLVMIATMPLMALISLGLLIIDVISVLLSFLISVLLGFAFPNVQLPTFYNIYRLTNRRLIIERLLTGKELASVSLDQFDAIDIEVLPGQDWYPAGELIFRRGDVETFRISGVARPEAFRQACLRAHQAHVGVKKALGG